MRQKPVVLAAFAALLVSFALSSQAHGALIDTHHDPAADFKSYKTYHWQKPEGPGGAGVDGPVRAAIDEGLTKKGLRRVAVEESADLEVRYNAGAVSTLTAGVGVTAGWWGDLLLIPAGEWYTTAGISVILTDLKTGNVVWTGWKVVKGTNPNAPQVMVKRAPGYASKIIEKYPPK